MRTVTAHWFLMQCVKELSAIMLQHKNQPEWSPINSSINPTAEIHRIYAICKFNNTSFFNHSYFPTCNINWISCITIQELSKPRQHAGNGKYLMSCITLYNFGSSLILVIIQQCCHDSRNKPTGVQITLKYWLISCYTTELRKLNMLDYGSLHYQGQTGTQVGVKSSVCVAWTNF